MKTSELTGAALDWAVAKADGKAPKIDCTSFRNAFIYRVYLGWSYEHSINGSIVEYKPSTDWSKGGPIIEREKIDRIATNVSGGFTASKKIVHLLGDDSFNVRWVHGSGSTLLIAAMRCYVASKLGDDVDVPEEIQNGL